MTPPQFLLNNWYVAAFAQHLAGGQSLARRICNLPVVLFRTAEGRAVALEDRCSHRAMPLSAGGQCAGNVIRCPYHGFEFDEHGACVKIPTQAAIPANAGIRAFPIVERDFVLWIWPGDPSHRDDSLIPPFPYHSDPQWEWTSMMLEFEADWMLVLDNLMDMTHIAFVHQAVINGDTNAQLTAKTSVTPSPRGLKIVRHMPNCDPPPQYQMGGGLKGKIDRWQEIDFVPGLARFWTGGTDAGTGAFEGRRDGGVQLRHFHAVTPKGPYSCYYHMTLARNFGLGNAELGARLQEGSRVTVDVEDRKVIEAQQARILDEPERKFVDIQSDAAGIQSRRIVRRLIEKEHEQLRSASR
jgi:vanillate O-demethylase monooxygenase subunit